MHLKYSNPGRALWCAVMTIASNITQQLLAQFVYAGSGTQAGVRGLHERHIITRYHGVPDRLKALDVFWDAVQRFMRRKAYILRIAHKGIPLSLRFWIIA